MSNSLDLDETAHNEASLPALRCLQKPLIIACGCERVKLIRCKKKKKKKKSLWLHKKKKLPYYSAETFAIFMASTGLILKINSKAASFYQITQAPG